MTGKNIIIIFSLMLFSCKNPIRIMNWGMDKFSTVDSDNNYLIALNDNGNNQVSSSVTIEDLLALRVRNDLENFRYATTVRVTPKKSPNTKFAFEEIESIELILTEGEEKFKNIPLAERYNPETGTFSFYIVSGKNIGYTTITVKVNDRELLQKKKIYFFENLPYEAQIRFLDSNGNLKNSKRFCTSSTSDCQDYLNVYVRALKDQSGNTYYENAKVKINPTCRYYQSSSNERIFNLTPEPCTFASKRLTPQPDGDANYIFNNLNFVTQVYFSQNNPPSSTAGSVFGIPFFDFLVNEPEILLALHHANPDPNFIIDNPSLNDIKFALNLNRLFEENYSNNNGTYNENLKSPLYSEEINPQNISSIDHLPPSYNYGYEVPQGTPIANSNSANYKPFHIDLNQTRTFTFIPVSSESNGTIRALGSYLIDNLNIGALKNLNGTSFSSIYQGNSEYRYNFNLHTGNEAGRLEFQIALDNKINTYNKRLIVYPNLPENINFLNFITVNSQDTYTYTNNFTIEGRDDLIANGNNLDFNFSEQNLISSRNGKFDFLIQPRDEFNNLWEIWDNSDGDGISKRLYHNYILIDDTARDIDFYRDPCDMGYKGGVQDPDSTDNAINTPRCAVRLNTYSQDGSFIVECYDFTLPAEYNFHPRGQNNPYNNINYYYGFSSQNPSSNGQRAKVIVQPENQDIGGARGGIATYFDDPVYHNANSSGYVSSYMWDNKTLRICPRNNDDYYVRDNAINHYNFINLEVNSSYSNYIERPSNGNEDGEDFVNLIYLQSPSDMNLHETHRVNIDSEKLILSYSSDNIIDNGGNENSSRGYCENGNPGICTKIFTPHEDITFFPIPGQAQEHDVYFATQSDESFITRYALRNNNQNPTLINSNSLEYYEFGISRIDVLNGYTVSKNLKQCYRLIQNCSGQSCQTEVQYGLCGSSGYENQERACTNPNDENSFGLCAQQCWRLIPRICECTDGGTWTPSTTACSIGTEINCINEHNEFGSCNSTYTQTACPNDQGAWIPCTEQYGEPVYFPNHLACTKHSETYANRSYTFNNSNPVLDKTCSLNTNFEFECHIRTGHGEDPSQTTDFLFPDNELDHFSHPESRFCENDTQAINEDSIADRYQTIRIHFQTRGKKPDRKYRWYQFSGIEKNTN